MLQPGVTSMAFMLKDDRRDEIGLLSVDTGLQSFTFSFYLHPLFSSVFSKPRFSEAPEFRQVFQAGFPLTSHVDFLLLQSVNLTTLRRWWTNPWTWPLERLLNSGRENCSRIRKHHLPPTVLPLQVTSSL